MDAAPTLTPYTIALQFIGVAETPGAVHNAQVLAMLQLDDPSVHADEVPWCSAFVNYIAWLCGLPRSRSLAARSWLKVGQPVALEQATSDRDVVVLSRGVNPPGPSVFSAPGHVGFFAMLLERPDRVRLLGGNQRDQVCFEDFPAWRVLGVRRLV